MDPLAATLVGISLLLVAYTYAGYPLLLRLIGGWLPRREAPRDPREWPSVSITVPAYNEEAQIAGVLDALLALDYPAERRQILVVSDASTDRTDEIVRAYADRGVELLRMPERRGKTAAENAARQHLRGQIVVNTDASIRIDPHALKPLVRSFADPSVGLASGRDVSVAAKRDDANVGESGYVGYEMGIRALETRLSGIVGASGCFYAIRAELHNTHLPEGLSRDFAAALVTHEHGYRAVSVNEAVCYVPRTGSLHREYSRKVRTIARGMKTLAYKRHLLNPLRHRHFAWMLFSHKICRWLVPWAGVTFLAGLLLLAPTHPWAAGALGVLAAVLALGVAGWLLSERIPLPRWLAVPAFALAGNAAALHAAFRALQGHQTQVWEPTRREVVVTP